MSILSEYEDIKKQIGEDKWNAIDKYIDTKRPDLRLDEIVYEPENWMEFEKWFYNQKSYLVNVAYYWKDEESDYDEYRATVEIGEGEKIYGTTVVNYTEKDIRNLVGKLNEVLKPDEIKNAIAILVLRDFDNYATLPTISKVSDLLKEIYDSIRQSESGMCFITYDDWKECFAEDYTNDDIEVLKAEIKKYGLEDYITFDDGDCKIMGFTDLETAFIDDRKEPVKEMTALEFLNEEKEMIKHNIYCYADGNFISKAKKGYEKEFAREQQKLIIVEKLINEERIKEKHNKDYER